MLIKVHFKNIPALTPDTPLSLKLSFSLSLSAATALCGINYATAFRRRRCCVLSSSYAQPARLKQFPTAEIHKCIFGNEDTS
jgi:hypothetical protein